MESHQTPELVPFTGSLKYGGVNKLKHFACRRDFLMHKIPRIKHTQNAPDPGIKHFSNHSIWSHSFQSHSEYDIPCITKI